MTSKEQLREVSEKIDVVLIDTISRFNKANQRKYKGTTDRVVIEDWVKYHRETRKQLLDIISNHTANIREALK